MVLQLWSGPGHVTQSLCYEKWSSVNVSVKHSPISRDVCSWRNGVDSRLSALLACGPLFHLWEILVLFGSYLFECSSGSRISWGRGHQLLNFRHKPIIWQDFCRKLPDFQMTEIGPGAGVPSPPPGSTANGMFKFPFYNSRFLRQNVQVWSWSWLTDWLIIWSFFSSCLLLM